MKKGQKVWTGRYWMTDKQARKISFSLKKHFEKNTVWNKGLRYSKYGDKTASQVLRKDSKYYLNELRENAIRAKKKGYHDSPDRREEIKALTNKKQIETGVGRKRREWDNWELEYLRKNYKKENYLEIALTLNRSWSSINHKVTRLGLKKHNKWT